MADPERTNDTSIRFRDEFLEIDLDFSEQAWQSVDDRIVDYGLELREIVVESEIGRSEVATGQSVFWTTGKKIAIWNVSRVERK